MSDLRGKTPVEHYDDTGDRKMVKELWAWLVEETPGSEGIPATAMPERHGIRIVPLMGADRARVESYREEAVSLRIALGCPVRLVRFTTREVIEELK
jgi:hypothetical protein